MGLENKEDVLNVAGYWTLGVTRGLVTVAVPVLAVSIAAGFMLKVIRIGAKIGGMD